MKNDVCYTWKKNLSLQNKNYNFDSYSCNNLFLNYTNNNKFY